VLGASALGAAWKALFRYLGEVGHSSQLIGGLPEPWRAVYHAGVYGADVDNGGLDQFFFNNRKKDDLTLDALETIGASTHARLFDQACIIARGKRYESRYERAVKTGDLALAVLGNREGWYEQLEKKFWRLKPVDDFLESYIRRNWGEFGPDDLLPPARAKRARR